MRNFLFPKVFQTVGWILFIPAFVAGVLCWFSVFNLAGNAEIIVNDVVIIGITLGALFIGCSKEVCEDEMIRAIRHTSLLNALYVYVILLILGTLFINGLAYLNFMMLNLGLLPIIFVIIFRVEMYKYYRENDNEK